VNKFALTVLNHQKTWSFGDWRANPLLLSRQEIIDLLDHVRRGVDCRESHDPLFPVHRLLAEGHIGLALQLAGKAMYRFRTLVQFRLLLQDNDILQTGFLGLMLATRRLRPAPGQDSVVAFLSDEIAGQIRRTLFPGKTKATQLPSASIQTHTSDAQQTERRAKLFRYCDIDAVEKGETSADDIIDALCDKPSQSLSDSEERELTELKHSLFTDPFELAIIDLRANGKTFKEIAVALDSSETTVNDRYRLKILPLVNDANNLRQCTTERQAVKTQYSYTGWGTNTCPLYAAPVDTDLAAENHYNEWSLPWADILVDEYAIKHTHTSDKQHKKRLQEIVNTARALLTKWAELSNGKWKPSKLVPPRPLRLDELNARNRVAKRLRREAMSLGYAREGLSPLEKTWKHKSKYKPAFATLADCKASKYKIRQGDNSIAEPDDWFPGTCKISKPPKGTPEREAWDKERDECLRTAINADRMQEENRYWHAVREMDRLEKAIESPVKTRIKPTGFSVAAAERERAGHMLSLIPATHQPTLEPMLLASGDALAALDSPLTPDFRLRIDVGHSLAPPMAFREDTIALR